MRFLARFSVVTMACWAVTVTADLSAASASTQDTDEYAVQIAFAPDLEKQLARVNRVEQERERRFRRSGTDVFHSIRSMDRHNKSRLEGTLWAGSRLIPEVERYGVEALLEAMVRENLRRAAPDDFDRVVRLRIERLQVSNHPVSTLSTSSSSWAAGTIELVDPATGAVTERHSITANLAPKKTAARNYQGDDFAFYEPDARLRVGPTLAYFVKRALSRFLPEERLAGPVLVLVGPGQEV